MFLEMHDNEAPTLCAAARNLDYMYQAEQWQATKGLETYSR
jgi:hypothetical protein